VTIIDDPDRRVSLGKRQRADLFRTRLTAALLSSGTSRAGLARSIGIDRSTVTQMLAPEQTRMPGGHVVAATAEALGVSADWLLGLSGPARTGRCAAGKLVFHIGNRARDRPG
jgi:transcriptional regulator with XRE-family HTH domain